MTQSLSNLQELARPEVGMAFLEWLQNHPNEIVEYFMNDSFVLEGLSSFEGIDVSTTAEELEICREQIASLKQERECQRQEFSDYQKEIKACHQELAFLHQELTRVNQDLHISQQSLISLKQAISILIECP